MPSHRLTVLDTISVIIICENRFSPTDSGRPTDCLNRKNLWASLNLWEITKSNDASLNFDPRYAHFQKTHSMNQSLTLPMLCLLLGGLAGYGLRDQSLMQEEQAVPMALNENLGDSAFTSDVLEPSAANDQASSDLELSLGDLMKELLVDYDWKSAQKEVEKLTVKELQSALVLLAATPKSSESEALQTQLFMAWAALDPHAAWQAALADPSDKNSERLLSSVARELAKTNPRAAIELAMSLGMGSKRSSVLEGVFSEWCMVDVSAAMTYANAHPDLSVEWHAFCGGLTRIAKTDPLKAANLASSFKGEKECHFLLSTVMPYWVELDPSAALKWAQSQTNPQLREDATAAAVGAWAALDPAAALSFVQSIADGGIRSSAFKKAWGDWFQNDPDAAATYAASIKEENLLETVNFHFVYSTEGLRPKERATLLARLPEGKVKQGIYRDLALQKTYHGEFNEAIEMLNALPDSSARDRQVTQFGQSWAKADLAAAAAWLKIQPASTDRDLALAGYALALAEKNPSAAIREVNTIPDPALRRDALKVVAFRWYQSDPVQTEAWMTDSSGFSEEDIHFVRFKAKVPGDYLPLTPTVSMRR
jgi:hypothetical protein